MTTKQPTISVIIPTTGNNQSLNKCLRSIRKQDFPQSNIQILSVTNQDLEKLKKDFSFATAVNLAAKKAKGNFLLITNDDVFFSKNAIKTWLKHAKAKPIALFGANISLPNGKPAPAGYKINLWTGLIKPIYTSPKSQTRDWISGCSLLVSKQIFEKLNGFDENFSPGFFEDADFCIRAKKSGIPSLLLPDVKITHSQTKTFNKDKIKKYEYWYRNKILFFRKHASLAQLVSFLFLQYAIFTPARAIIKQDGRLIPAIKGLTWNIRNYTLMPNA